MNEQNQLVKAGKQYTDSIIKLFTNEVSKFHLDKEKTNTPSSLTDDLKEIPDHLILLNNEQ